MINSLKNISDSIAIITQNNMKDTINVIILNSDSVYLKLIPILIAILALFVTAYSIYISRKTLYSNIQHNKLSVQPLLNTNEDFTFSDQGIGIKLISCGLGPAIIENFQLLWNGTDITNNDNPIIIYDSLNIHNVQLGTLMKNGILGKDYIHWILRIPPAELPFNRNNIIRSNEILELIRKNLSYTIVYTSIYRDNKNEYTLKYPFIKK